MTFDQGQFLAHIRERFGDSDTNIYLAMLRATRGLIQGWITYADAPPGTAEEKYAGETLSMAMEMFRDRPEKAVEMLQSLLAIVHHLSLGGTLDEWFVDDRGETL